MQRFILRMPTTLTHICTKSIFPLTVGKIFCLVDSITFSMPCFIIVAYKDEEGKPCVLPVVRRVEAAMACDHTLNHEYLPITGLTSFTDAVSKLLLGSASSAIVDRRVRNLLPWQHCSRAASIWHREALFVVF
jgi:hypothetical protein